MKSVCLPLSIAICSAFVTSHANASTVLAENFVRTSAGETITVPFTAGNGVATTESYSGLVEIIVSGTGFAFGENTNDAFYGVTGADERFRGEGVTLEDSQFYQLNIGWNDEPLAPFAGADRNIVNYIVFADGFGYTTPPYRPDYSQSHIYHFIVQVPENAGTLSFGVADGGYDDNGGEYTISTYAVTAVPIPAAAWLLGSALGLMGFMRRTCAS